MRGNLVVLILATFLSALLFWPIFIGKVNLNGNLLVSFYPTFGENLPYKNTGWDQLRIYFPFYKITLESFRNFEVPLWNPYAFSGHPHLADFQTAVFYPLNFIGIFLSQTGFWHLLRISPTILASFFAFLYLRNLKLSTLSSLFGAVTFGFSPFILTWGEEVVMSPHSIVWIPLILLSIDRFLENKKKKSLLLISLASAASLFGGYMQTSIYLFIFAGAYLVFRFLADSKNDRKRVINFVRIIGAFVFGALISSVQLIPSAELYFNSGRATETIRESLFSFLLPIHSLVTFFGPDLFGHPATGNFFRGGSAQYYEGIIFVGVAALIFAVFEIIRQPRDKFAMFLAVFGLVALSTTFDLPTSRLFLSLPIPFLSTSIANRVLFIPLFCLAVLAAFGFEHWYLAKDKKIFKILVFFGALYIELIIYLIGAANSHLPYFKSPNFASTFGALISLRNLVIPFGIFLTTAILIWLGTLRQNLKIYTALGVIVLAIVHIFYFSQKYFSFTGRRYVFPENKILEFITKKQGYFRSWAVGEARLENNFATQYEIFWPEGYDSLNNRSYGEFTYAMQNNNFSGFVFRADAGLGRGKTEELLTSESRRKLVDMVGVKYIIAKAGDLPFLEGNNFEEVFRDGDYLVLANKQVIPRAFLASSYAKVAEERHLIPQNLLSENFNFKDTLILEESPPIAPQVGEGSAEITSYKPQEVVVKTQSQAPKLLFLSDNYYPGWKAQVDGDETKILRANYTFRAVPLAQGEHEVRFYYDSNSFKLGLLISIFSLSGVCYLYFFRKKRTSG